MNDEKIAKFGEILFKFNKIHSLTNYKDIKPVVADSLLGLKYILSNVQFHILHIHFLPLFLLVLKLIYYCFYLFV